MIVPVDLTPLQLEALYHCHGWQSRYKLLLNWSKYLPRQPDIQTEKHAVKGCESKTWLVHQNTNNKHSFVIDSESRVVKGLAVLLLLLINNKEASEILSPSIEETFIELGLAKHLSPSRSNGFKAMLEKAREAVEAE